MGKGEDARQRRCISNLLQSLIKEHGRDPSSVSKFRALISQGSASDIAEQNSHDYKNCFHLAAECASAELLREVLETYRRWCGSPSNEASCSNYSPAAAMASALSLRSKRDKAPLDEAAERGDLETVNLLLEAGALKEAANKSEFTPFFRACCLGNTSVLDALEFPNCVFARILALKAFTALHVCVQEGHIDAVRWLLRHGAPVDAISTDGDTPLSLAALKGDCQIIECLVLQGNASLQPCALPPATSGGAISALARAHGSEMYDAARCLVKAIRKRGAESVKGALDAPDHVYGATVLHFFAAYGSAEDISWILRLVRSKIESEVPLDFGRNALNKTDKLGRTPVHWAAEGNNRGILDFLAKKRADLHAKTHADRYKTPMAVAVLHGSMEFAEELLKHTSEAAGRDGWKRSLRTWMREYYTDDDKGLQRKLRRLKAGFEKHTESTTNEAAWALFDEIPLIFLALHCNRDDIAKFIQQHSQGVNEAVNEKGKRTGRTALHWATLLKETKIVAQLCRVAAFARELTANAEDKLGKTALQYAKEMKLEDIEKELMLRSDVNSSIDALYKDRQVYVDATNAILVGAALIAGVTFAGWLQPPLSYLPYYNLPQQPAPSPPDIFQAYAAVQQHMGVRVFWIFNSLSFGFAIAAMVAGLVAVVPIPGIYIGASVLHLRRCLLIACSLIGFSIVFVLGAFAAAGFAVLPPLFKFQASMMATVIVSGIPCLLLLGWYAHRLWFIGREMMKRIGAKVRCRVRQLGGTLLAQVCIHRMDVMDCAPSPGLTEACTGLTEVMDCAPTSGLTQATYSVGWDLATNYHELLDLDELREDLHKLLESLD